MENKIYIGIDPGKNGYITIFYKEKFFFYPIPLIGGEYDVNTLSEVFKTSIFSNYSNVYCVIEDVHAIFGASASSTFSFGFGIGLLEGILTTLKIPFTKVSPKKWQKQMFEGVPNMTKPSSTGKTMKSDTKGMALIAAKRIFPDIDLRDNDKCKKAHDGKVDSLLICEYAKRNF
jgi:hypothetical protein